MCMWKLAATVLHESSSLHDLGYVPVLLKVLDTKGVYFGTRLTRIPCFFCYERTHRRAKSV